jgi:drug/metabolite transporter (DMT)-like permease
MYQNSNTSPSTDYASAQDAHVANDDTNNTSEVPDTATLADTEIEQTPKPAHPNLNWTVLSFIAFIVLGALWGSAFLFIKVAVDDKTGFAPLTMVALRMVMATILMWGYLFINMIRSSELRTKINQNRSTKTILKFFILGFFNNAVPFAFVGIAETSINSGVTSILDSTIPLFSIIFAHFFLKGERISVLKVFGLIVGFGGVVLVCLNQVYASVEPLTVHDIVGYIIVSLASASYAVASVFARKYLQGVPGDFVATGQITSAAIMMVIVSLFWDLGLSGSHYRFFRTASWQAWGSIVYLAVCSTLMAYLCYFYLIKTVGAVKQTMVGYLLPVFGVFEGAMFLHEWDGLAWYFIVLEIVGAILICAGIAVVSLPSVSDVRDLIGRSSKSRKGKTELLDFENEKQSLMGSPQKAVNYYSEVEQQSYNVEANKTI